MGLLHYGHLLLAARARRPRNVAVVVPVFRIPQFGCSTQGQKGGNFNSHGVELSTATYAPERIRPGTSPVGWESLVWPLGDPFPSFSTFYIALCNLQLIRRYYQRHRHRAVQRQGPAICVQAHFTACKPFLSTSFFPSVTGEAALNPGTGATGCKDKQARV